MNILGLDLSSKKSGYSLFCNNELKDYGVWAIDSETEKDWRARIGFMADCLDKYCNAHNIDKIYIEDVPPMLDNTQTVKVLSALQGCIIAICNLNDIKYQFVSVRAWKSIIGIDLTHSKEFIACKKQIDKKFLPKLKTLTKAYEKRVSVGYANLNFGINLIYKSPSSKYNEDDVADSINIVWSQLDGVNTNKHKPNRVNIMNKIYNEVHNKKNEEE